MENKNEKPPPRRSSTRLYVEQSLAPKPWTTPWTNQSTKETVDQTSKCLVDDHDEPVWHPGRTHIIKKNVCIMRSSFVSSFQNFKMEPEKEKNKTKPEKKTHGVLQPRSSRLLINDDFPFRLEKVNCVLYFSIHPPSSAPWELFYGWPRSR